MRGWSGAPAKIRKTLTGPTPRPGSGTPRNWSRTRKSALQTPMDTVVSATSRAAESLGLGDRVGTIAAGMDADVIALDGDPIADPTAFTRVVFVMRAGSVYRNEPGRRR